jgi:prophage regulatory protein
VTIPETGYMRLRHIIGDPKASPPIPPVIPVSRTTFWNWVKDGKLPQPVKLGPGITAWRVEDIREYIQNAVQSNEGAAT